MASDSYSLNDSSNPSLWALVGNPLIQGAGAVAGANTAAGGYKAAAGGMTAAGAASAAALSPYATTGSSAESALASLYGLGGAAPNYSAFENQPGYEFMKTQGTQAINRGAAATGGGFSSSTLGALSNYNSGLANSTFSQYLSNLYGLTGLGAGAAANYGSQQIEAAKGAGTFRTGAGIATAGGINGAAGGLGLAANGLAQVFGGSNLTPPNADTSGLDSANSSAVASLYGNANSSNAAWLAAQNNANASGIYSPNYDSDTGVYIADPTS
jgi:hypothetical protein